MTESSPRELGELLQRKKLRIRTGVVLLPSVSLGQEPDLAATTGLQTVNWQAWRCERMNSESRYLSLSSEKLFQDLREIVRDGNLAGRCLWVFNADLLLSALKREERERFWSFFHSDFKESRGLLISLPVDAFNLFSVQERETWRRDERLATWKGSE